MPTSSFPRQAWWLLIGLALGWGINWPIMKVVVEEVPPLTFRGGCLVLGGLGVLAIARGMRLELRLPPGSRWPLFWLTVTNIVGWNICATYGVQYLSSGRAALLGYTMPAWCVPLSMWLLGERLTPARVVALVLGLGGVAVLMGDGLADLSRAPLGVALMVGAAWLWAAGVVLLKYYRLPVNTVVLTAWMMIWGGVPMLLAAFLVDGLPTRLPTFWPAFGLVYNTLIGFMFCYWAWNRYVLLVPVAVSSLSSLVTPLVGVAAGAAFLNETPGWREAVAAVLIVAAVAVISLDGRRRDAS